MTYEIANKLETIAWEKVEPIWQKKIQGAIAIQTPPSCLSFPKNQESLSEIIKFASEKRFSVLPCGSGSKLRWGGLVKDARLVVSTQHLDRIIEHAVGDLTVTVEAGVKLADLQKLLSQSHQFLPLDPAYPESATIGGIVATADSGSWRQRYGGVRDMVLGLSFVRADGQIAKAGGRVVKNVAGYDLMKLFTGSYGTLGIISQVTFRLYPIPEASQTIVLTGETNAIAAATQTLLMSGLAPTAAQMLSGSLVNRLEIGKEIGLAIRFQSIVESVKEQIGQVESVARQLGLKTSSYCDRDETNLWQKLQQITRVPSSENAVTCKIAVRPNAASKILEQCDRITNNQGAIAINISSGLGQLHCQHGEINQIQKMRSLCQEHQGFLTILEAPISVKKQLDQWGYTGNALEMMRQIKQKFDPNNIFSPGCFVGEI
ncbi:FAD-binding oxidoreductase [Hydrococcus rivularis NIES-593]|uniref:FAD-binding oxidoreductase n=1 Tax=Hydrococcus rivularis NIES-593 TaxID=1921803 RepID=A0A1U7H7U6_9CYAN|nr:FAD-binding oxidoreductase [Hydrococcus rivularis]OKH18825.1 FAD-binding oxidoreductase [Hydrococcus rivularis NIES-593]